jgi:hypothetical protein
MTEGQLLREGGVVTVFEAVLGCLCHEESEKPGYTSKFVLPPSCGCKIRPKVTQRSGE